MHHGAGCVSTRDQNAAIGKKHGRIMVKPWFHRLTHVYLLVAFESLATENGREEYRIPDRSIKIVVPAIDYENLTRGQGDGVVHGAVILRGIAEEVLLQG